MANSVTVRLDKETARILKDLARREDGSKSSAIKRALRERWRAESEGRQPTAWQVYSKLSLPPTRGVRRDRARHTKKLMKEILLAKWRNGAL
jgi:hypothetical protein